MLTSLRLSLKQPQGKCQTNPKPRRARVRGALPAANSLTARIPSDFVALSSQRRLQQQPLTGTCRGRLIVEVSYLVPLDLWESWRVTGEGCRAQRELCLPARLPRVRVSAGSLMKNALRRAVGLLKPPASSDGAALRTPSPSSRSVACATHCCIISCVPLHRGSQRSSSRHGRREGVSWNLRTSVNSHN